jgi:hypothetical protein
MTAKQLTPDQKLDKLVQLAIEHAERVLIGNPGASIMPSFVIESANGEMAIIATPWSSERDKDITVFALRATMRKGGAVRYSFISEAWMATAKPGQEKLARLPAGEMPSQRPDRIEVVIISASDDKEVRSAMLRIIRGEGGTVIKLVRDRAEAKHVEGRFADLLKPDSEQS